jgi:hypothetical protein
MARAVLETPHSAAPLTEYERTHVIRRLPAERDQRYRALAEKQSRGMLTASERDELGRLVDESERLSIENAQALLRHRDPAAFAALRKRAARTGRRSTDASAKSQQA